MSMNEQDFYTGARIGDEADKRLVVRFSMQPRLDHTKTAAEGREIFREIEFVTILIPGDKTLTVHRPIKAEDKVRFQVQYNTWKANQGAPLDGTPLSVILVSESQRKELDYFHINTVEQLAEVNDNFAGQMSGVQALKAQAQRYLRTVKEKAPELRLMAELKQRDDQLAAMQDQLSKLAALIPAQPAQKPSKEK
jgi:hypothetical protein